MSLSLAELGEISKAQAYEDVSKIGVPGWGRVAGAAGAAAGKARGASNRAQYAAGRKMGDWFAKPVRERTAKVEAGIADALTEHGGKLGEAIGQNVGANIDRATKRATNRALAAGIGGAGGGALIYDVVRRREYKRRKRELEGLRDQERQRRANA